MQWLTHFGSAIGAYVAMSAPKSQKREKEELETDLVECLFAIQGAVLYVDLKELAGLPIQSLTVSTHILYPIPIDFLTMVVRLSIFSLFTPNQVLMESL
jgi:hypothetical protein